MSLMVNVFVPVRSALAGMLNVYSWLGPRQVPRVMLREFRSVDGGEALDGEVKPPMLIAGRPPAKPMVMPMRSTAPLDGTEERLKLMFSGELTALNMAIGIAPAPLDALTVPTFHDDMRGSEGCIVSILSALRKPRGVPSHVPSCITLPAAGTLPDREMLLVRPADTVTVVVLPTASSPAYRVAV